MVLPRGGRALRPVSTLMFKAVAVAVGFLLAGNLAILAASAWARQTTPTVTPEALPGVDNFQVVDDRVWRGAAPTREGYEALARAGTTTVVDLRAEDGLGDDVRTVTELGMKLVHLPVRDGQVPSADKIEAFLASTADPGAKVFVHCGAGVGRTGAMVGAYLVSNGGADGPAALRRNLAVGPPSLEQVAFVARLQGDELERPNPVLTGVSRVLDAPRRLWSRYGA
jgi:protein-tyrosine phosphatase